MACHPPLTGAAILPYLRRGVLTGIPAAATLRVGEPCPGLDLLTTERLARLRPTCRGRRYLLTGLPPSPSGDLLCRARALAQCTAVGLLHGSVRLLLACCDAVLLPGGTGWGLHRSAALRRPARLRLVGSGPGRPPLEVPGSVARALGAGRFLVEVPLASWRAEEILARWLQAGWRVESSGVVYPALAAVLDGSLPGDSFPASGRPPDSYRYDSRDAPAHRS